jgi:hypothetical protein
MTPDDQLERVKQLIETLPREDRAKLRPWVLAVFDVSGNFSQPFHAKRARVEGLE